MQHSSQQVVVLTSTSAQRTFAALMSLPVHLRSKLLQLVAHLTETAQCRPWQWCSAPCGQPVPLL